MSEQLLEQCQRYFPGLAWHLDDGYEQAFAHCFLGGDLRFDFSLTWNGESYGFTIQVARQIRLASFTGLTPASALAQAAALWREFAAEAMAVVGPVPEPKPSPEHQRQSGMAITAYVMEGDRRKAQGLPPDREAQTRAGAEAMAWAEDNPG